MSKSCTLALMLERAMPALFGGGTSYGNEQPGGVVSMDTSRLSARGRKLTDSRSWTTPQTGKCRSSGVLPELL